MIRISENATPRNSQRDESWMQLQEARVLGFPSFFLNDLWHKHDQCKCSCIMNKGHQAIIKILHTFLLQEQHF